MAPDRPDPDAFPAPVYKDTVLAPLFEGAKRHHLEPFRRVNRAHCVMLAETGLLTPDQASAIARALADIDATLDPEALSFTGEVEDFFFLIEGELIRRLGVDLAGRLHTGRSRNDIDHTVFKLTLKARIDALAQAGRALAAVLLDKAAAERDTLIVAYTHGQPAQPSTFGHYLSAAAEVLLRDLDRLAAARGTVDLCSMGAAAITTTGFAIDRHRMAELLGFAAPQENSYGCIAAVDYVTCTYSALQLMALHLGRVVQDLQYWTGFEVGQLHVPGAYVQISSIMPQKRNPVPIEHLRLLLSLAGGRAAAQLGTMHNTPFTDMNDSEGEVQVAGYAAFEALDRALRLMAGLIGAVTVDADRVRATTDAACITITELADGLVRREGLSFRQAHEIAAAVARAMIAERRSLEEAGYPAFAAAFEHSAGRPPSVDRAAFAEMVSPEHFVAVRDRFGGPAPAALDAALGRHRERLAALTAAADEATAGEAQAAAALDRAFVRLAAGASA